LLCRLCAQHEIDLLPAAKPETSLLLDWKLTLRPWLDTAIGRPGTITGDEWLAACDRVEAASTRRGRRSGRPWCASGRLPAKSR
jgi:hypothetical protein